MIRYAATTLTKASPKLMVYIDAGHPFWVNAEEMATRLRSAGIESARGFSINVSSFASVSDNVTYGTYLSNLLGGKRYLIDSSRNGNGRAPNGEWCNPSGRALGQSGTLYAGTRGALDGVLWIKFPGESDGTCNGGPGAGQWWPEYATALYTNRP
jgi:endoglucanase